MEKVDLLVVGGGAAGMSAALAAASAGAVSVLLADREARLGGILPQCIHHGFGLGYFHRDLTGPEYAGRIIAQMEGAAVSVRLNTTVLSLSQRRTAELSGPAGYETVSFRRLILASGCRERTIGSLPVTGTRPAGVYTAGLVQRMLNLHHWKPGRRALVLGSGDLGLIVARRLALTGCQVVGVVEQQGSCGGMVRNCRSCLLEHNISLVTKATVTRLHGEGRLTGVTLRRLDSGKEEQVSCDTLVTALGLIPERELLDSLGGKVPGWASLCGNCDYVHEIVDTVTTQAEELGRQVGLELFGKG